jgi:hypothetical protein
MPKKHPRNNRQNPDRRTIQTAAALLQRISQKAGVPQASQGAAASSDRLLDGLHKALEPLLASHLISVLEKPGELVLFTDSAVWAGRLKLAMVDLADFARGRRVAVRVMPREGYRP